MHANLRETVRSTDLIRAGLRIRAKLRECACAVARLGREGFQLQAVGGGEVLDVGGKERQAMLDGGGADQGIGQAHAVG